MIIGFAGKAGVGKDTAGKYLKLKKWKQHSFAAPLKRVCAKFLELPLAAMSNRELKDMELDKPFKLTEDDADALMSYIPYPIQCHEIANRVRSAVAGKEIHSIRELLQFVGTDVGRNIISSNIWLNIAEGEINNLSKKFNVVLTDVRFENERDLIKKLNGIVIEVQRNTSLSDVTKHESENIDFKTDYIIDNNEYHQFMYDQIENILQEQL